MPDIGEMGKDPSERVGQVQQKPLVIIDVPPYGRFSIRCHTNDRVYDISFLGGKLQKVIHTEEVKV